MSLTTHVGVHLLRAARQHLVGQGRLVLVFEFLLVGVHFVSQNPVQEGVLDRHSG